MVMGVLSKAFDVLVLKFGVQKRIYCNVSTSPVRDSASSVSPEQPGITAGSGCPGALLCQPCNRQSCA